MARSLRFSLESKMIEQLASPSVCVIDDEPDDYWPILAALNGLFVSCVHLPGTIDSWPEEPFRRLRLVFLDLHLSGPIGKDAASYTANYFRHVVSLDTAPIVVVIWSKYAGDKVAADGVPTEDQETESQLFIRTLLDAEPGYRGRLIFLEMAKPTRDDRPQDWAGLLKGQIETALQDQSAVELLWAWDNVVGDACAQVSRELTLVAQTSAVGGGRELKDGLKATLQRLARAQSEEALSPQNSPRYLLSVLTQLLLDQAEQPLGLAAISGHGTWLSEDPPGAVAAPFVAQMNGVLLTTDVHADSVFAPGTVFRISDANRFQETFGRSLDSLKAICGRVKVTQAARFAEWMAGVQPVLIELSPVCDLAQAYRVKSLLLGGVLVPAALIEHGKKDGDAFGALPRFYMRWPADRFPAQEVGLFFCHRYKTTLPDAEHPNWVEPWFKIRELPLTSIRNANSAHAARVGFVSLA